MAAVRSVLRVASAVRKNTAAVAGRVSAACQPTPLPTRGLSRGIVSTTRPVAVAVKTDALLGADDGKSGKAFTYNPADRLGGSGAPTVWQEFTPLAGETGAVNLGQGFPDWESPDFVKDAACRAINENHNQYARSAGHPPLVEALAERYSARLGRTIDPLTEVTISVGASEAIFACLQSIVNPGDGVLMFEPAFDIYIDSLKLAGGVPQFCPLRLADDEAGEPGEKKWTLDVEEFRRSITAATRVVMLNTPHNPTGKVFTEAELAAIAEVLEDYPDIVVLADEVYEFMTYGDHKHANVANAPGMWDRTLTISSAGKTFSITGWKVGFIVGPEHLVKAVTFINQSVQFSVVTPLQQATVYALEEAEKPYKGFDNYYLWLQDMYAAKREKLLAGLKSAGLKPVAPEGTFFIMADTSDFEVPEKYLEETTAAKPVMTRDWAFCRWSTIEHGVAAIPPSSFYTDENAHLAANLARFAFCKTDESLDEACKRFKVWGEKRGVKQE